MPICVFTNIYTETLIHKANNKAFGTKGNDSRMKFEMQKSMTRKSMRNTGASKLTFDVSNNNHNVCRIKIVNLKY